MWLVTAQPFTYEPTIDSSKLFGIDAMLTDSEGHAKMLAGIFMKERGGKDSFATHEEEGLTVYTSKGWMITVYRPHIVDSNFITERNAQRYTF